MIRKTTKLVMGTLTFGWAVADASRVLLTAAILRRARARHPELFDPIAAIKSVEEELKEVFLLGD